MTLSPFEIVLILVAGMACFFVYRFRQKLAESDSRHDSLKEEAGRISVELELAEKKGEEKQRDLQKQIDDFREEKQSLLLTKQELMLEKKHFEQSLGDKGQLIEQVEAQNSALSQEFDLQKQSLNDKIEILRKEKEELAQQLNDLRIENVESVNAQSLSEQESKQSKDHSLGLENRIHALTNEKMQLGQEIRSLELKYDQLNQSFQAQKVTVQEVQASREVLK